MSIRLVDAAWKVRGLNLGAKFVLVCLASHMNQQTRLCCPSNERIAEFTELSPSGVSKALRELREAGHIKSRQQGRLRVFELCLDVELPEPKAPPKPTPKAPKTAPRASQGPTQCKDHSYNRKSQSETNRVLPKGSIPILERRAIRIDPRLPETTRQIMAAMLEGVSEERLRPKYPEPEIIRARKEILACHRRIDEEVARYKAQLPA